MIPLLLTLALAGAPPTEAGPDDSPAVAETPGETLIDLTTADGVRAGYADVMRRSGDRYPADLDALVADMASVYRALSPAARAATRLPHGEASRMRRALTTRLELVRDRLIRDSRRAERATGGRGDSARKPDVARTNEPSRTIASRPSESRPGGGATAARAQQLIDLITNTIEPDSWDTQGGRGRIMFYSPLNVLVIRNTGEAHHQIGGTLEQLRK